MNATNGTPFPDINALGGRMVLHKGEGRNEEMYFFLCADWWRLRDLIEDPVKFFSKEIGLVNDLPMAPVVAVIEPAMKSLFASVATNVNNEETIKAVLGNQVDLTKKAVFNPKICSFIREMFGSDGEGPANFDSGTKVFSMPVKTDPLAAVLDADKSGKGWFFVEYANRTSVIHIYYHAPTEVPTEPTYKNGFTIPTTCQMKNSNFAQLHFDIITGQTAMDKTVTLERARADLAVDFIEDGGVRMCNGLKEIPHRESEIFEQIVNRPVNDSDANFKVDPSSLVNNLTYKTQAMAGKNTGPQFIIEGLSASTNGIDNLLDAPVFVCVQNPGNLQDGDMVFDNGVWKVYHPREA